MTGFLNHFTGDANRPWKDVSKDFEKPIEDDIDFLQPSLWRGPGDHPVVNFINVLHARFLYKILAPKNYKA